MPQTKYSVPKFNKDFFNRLGMAESSGRADVINPVSGATGVFQFTANTWKNAVKQAGKNYTLEDRKDPAKSREIASFLFNKEGSALAKSLGRDLTEADMYAYHHFGLGNSKKFLEALNQEDAGTAEATKLFPAVVIKQNPDVFFKNGKPRSVAEVYDVLQNKINPNKAELDRMSQRGYEMMPDPQQFAQSDDPFVRMAQQNGGTMTDAGRPGVGNIEVTQAQRDQEAANWARLRDELERETGIYRTQAPQAPVAAPQEERAWWENPLTDWMRSFR